MKRRLAAFFPVLAVVSLAVVSLSVGAAVRAAPPSAPWHLDRINQRSAPLDGNAEFGSLTGAGVVVYVVDSGVRGTHEQFSGRVKAGTDPVSDSGSSVVDPASTDCDGHGTHVAALAAGSTVGVAKGATVVAVRVLNCDGDGTVDDVVAALKWIRSHHVSGRAAVVNLSLGVDRNDDGAAIDAQVKELLAEGIIVTIAAGNGDDLGRPYDACDISPAHVPGALTVGASAVNDAVASYSNQGPCVDLFAPGGDSIERVLSAWIGAYTERDSRGNIIERSFLYPENPSNDAWYMRQLGTSMASPLVAGYAAMLAEQQPGLCANQISDAIVQRATPNVLTGLDPSSPNRLLYIDTTPVAASVPGRATNVVTSVSNGSVLASWDPPCDGGSAATKVTVSLIRDGKVVQRRVLGPSARIARFSNVRNGVRHRVSVRYSNAVGDGPATTKWKTPVVRRLSPGQTVAVRDIARFGGDLTLRWKVSSSSRSVCKILTNPTRLRFSRAGTCRVVLRTNAGVKAASHNLRVG